MRKLITILFVFALIVLLTGCNIKEMIGQKIGEEAGEKILEGLGGGDVEIDGDKVEFKGEDGENVLIGGGEWPDSELGKAIPEFKDGKITGVLDTSDGVMVTLEEVKAEDYKNYVSKIKDEFSQDTYETTTEDYAAFGGTNADGVSVMVQYTATEKTIIISAGKN